MERTQVEALFDQLWPPDRRIATTAQLHKAGLDGRTIAYGVKRGLLHHLRRGVYMPMRGWQGSKPWIREELVLQGHIAAANGTVIYSHFSAARLHKLRLWNCPQRIHISSGYRSSTLKGARDVVQHARTIDPQHLVRAVVPGVGVAVFTDLAHTVLECSMSAPFEQAVIIGDSALNSGLTMEALRELLESSAGRRGVKKARMAVEGLNGLSESAGETRTRLIVAELPIEQPELQITISTRGGAYRVDFAWPGIRLILEFDGDTKYFDYGVTTEQALINERVRENALIEEGWRFIRVKWSDLNAPEMLKARIMKAYWAAGRAAA
ncbi:type IV toxin-antitoxin system AbiEi family antitoxin domain-containing protein [Arthrobacter sp. TWP1-1]|uniref:type IV toxin-antitoxin system AbiEi family antitoxin domain-containing protein n=1 Tax=Arthrobacter sp. TWP1-1 TaxID=2804568 RepID=UPI003CEB4C71